MIWHILSPLSPLKRSRAPTHCWEDYFEEVSVPPKMYFVIIVSYFKEEGETIPLSVLIPHSH